MAISGDLKLFRSFFHHQLHPSRPAFSRSKNMLPFEGSLDFKNDAPKRPLIKPRCSSTKLDDNASNDRINQSFSERLSLAWNTLFPSTTTTKKSNAKIAKQRLRMILYSDRCEVSDEAKRKIVKRIIESLSDFVEIESQDKVQLNVSTDSDLGTVYSVIVPVARVKPEFRESEDDFKGKILSAEYRDKGDESGTVDVRFNFFVPDE